MPKNQSSRFRIGTHVVSCNGLRRTLSLALAQRGKDLNIRLTHGGLFQILGAWRIILAIGENVPALGSAEARAKFKAGVMDILRCALAKRHPLVVVRSCFWADAANAARSERAFTHDGVAGHPGDRGMKALADAIVQAVLRREAAPRQRAASVFVPTDSLSPLGAFRVLIG